MPEDVKFESARFGEVIFRQRENALSLSWSWLGEVEGVEIRFKESRLSAGEGSPFLDNMPILRRPGDRMGGVSRPITVEWGLYDFSLTACLRDGTREHTGWLRGVMIGDRRTVRWKTERRGRGGRLLFLENGFSVPPGVACMSYKMQDGTIFRYVLGSEVNDGTTLEFPDAAYLDQFDLSAKEPYNRAYSFRRL